MNKTVEFYLISAIRNDKTKCTPGIFNHTTWNQIHVLLFVMIEI